MLTRTGIRNLTHASFYARGLDLYLLDKVKELNIEETSFVEYISTKVKGSGTKVYDVRFHYDKAKDAVSECSCGCPAFASYDGLCKHLVAALLKYVDIKAAGADFLGDQDEGLSRERRGRSEYPGADHVSPTTTPEMKQFLEKQLTRRYILSMLI